MSAGDQCEGVDEAEKKLGEAERELLARSAQPSFWTDDKIYPCPTILNSPTAEA